MGNETQVDDDCLPEKQYAPENYSLDMVDTIFADTLSRGMQNAIVSQQNAQMASSSAVTSACARILQAQAKIAAKKTEDEAQDKPAEEGGVNKQNVCKKKKRQWL
ncbi:hypothetical protein VA7868_00440 [Vibrio aerogenes CECT 7868]|uniref:Killing trait n=1 Tax=Vibrio aerogenes CECT 7868 TaxID=1216006 RepID=A0A1M5VM26_9VIBR|nr:RebB family R body protein [Vibrio aerogenes]SHH76302.1 hypothetical protein VA7868_00440 [Vibrio aerogenes CECT 7868]